MKASGITLSLELSLNVREPKEEKAGRLPVEANAGFALFDMFDVFDVFEGVDDGVVDVDTHFRCLTGIVCQDSDIVVYISLQG